MSLASILLGIPFSSRYSEVVMSCVDDLTGRVALVTGGAGGIGGGAAAELARRGAAVVVLDHAQAGPADAARRLSGTTGAELTGVAASVVDPVEVGAAVTAVLDRYGRLDIAVNAAGVPGPRGPVTGLTDADWDLVVRTHLYGTMHVTRAVLPSMLAAGWGRIVNITSSAAWDPGPGLTPYAAAKAGITGFTRSVAAEVGQRGVTVNCVAPGLTATPAVEAKWPDPEDQAAQTRRLGSVVPRFGRVGEIAVAVATLCLPSAAYTTGSTVHVNGGSYMP
ncbi:SDR family oxidoreductase [Amycolatopsis bartoniae]|nr:SDR family oxidoreductase [Amycolatopsis bartoniae]